MADLVTLDDAKAHIRVIDSTQDQDLELKLAQATEIVLDYVNQRREATADVGDWAAIVAAWTDETVPAQVQAAILKQFAYLWRFRGDDENPPALENGLAPGVAALLARFRDPAIA
jgi:hypothetical protein